jgi:hypothetical protein
MSGARRASWAVVAAAGIVLLGLQSCEVSGVGVEGDVGVDYGADYYEGPCCYDYGWWGHGYRVGPGRGFEHGPDPAHSHPFHAAPAGHRSPSIPSRPRGRR